MLRVENRELARVFHEEREIIMWRDDSARGRGLTPLTLPHSNAMFELLLFFVGNGASSLSISHILRNGSNFESALLNSFCLPPGSVSTSHLPCITCTHYSQIAEKRTRKNAPFFPHKLMLSCEMREEEPHVAWWRRRRWKRAFSLSPYPPAVVGTKTTYTQYFPLRLAAKNCVLITHLLFPHRQRFFSSRNY